MADLKTQIGANAELVTAADELRRKVFIDEQGVPEDEVIDRSNSESVHAVVFDCNTPVATAKVIMLDGGNYRIGLVAVDKSRRGQHLGERVMRAAMDYIFLYDGKTVFLTAQRQVVGFYEKLGFEQCGAAEYLESGFVLVPMRCMNGTV